MIVDFYSYKVKLRSRKFITKDNREFESYVSISFYDEYKREIDYIELAYIDAQEIYDLIEKGEEINLDYCYIENFSVTNYKLQKNIPKHDLVKIKSISAKDAIFESKIATDFSHIETENLIFKDSKFINGYVDFSNSVIKNATDFTHVLFYNGKVNFNNTHFGKGDTIFKNSYFGKGTKDFQDTIYDEGFVSFVNVEFNDGDVIFVNADFSDGPVSFKISRFGNGKVDFHYSKFGEGDLSFERTEFGNGKIDFSKIEFGNGKVNFNRSFFGEGIKTFEASSVKKGKVTFKQVNFISGKINFEQIEYEHASITFDKTVFGQSNISFNKAEVKSISIKSCQLDRYFDFRVSKAGSIDLSNTIVRDIVDFTPFDFDVKIHEINFAGMRLLGKLFIDWKKNNVKELIYKQKKSTLETKAEQFRILKQNFNQTGQYNDEDKAYIEFKRCEAKDELHKSVKDKKQNAIWAYPSYWFKDLVFDKAGLYATDPMRVLWSMLISYAFFSFLFVIIYYINAGGLSVDEGQVGFFTYLGRSFYFSAITYLTVGYGDICPLGQNRWIASVEGFVGVFLMAYFTVAFVRKILR